MASQRIPIPYPSKGISENYGFNYQEERTCRDDRNVRTIDPRTGRMRGAQRAGLGLHAGGGQANGANKIKEICAVSNAQAQIAYSQNTTGTERWTNAEGVSGSVVDMRRGLYGSYYAVTSNNEAIILNEDGAELHRIGIPEVAPTGTTRVFAGCISVDEFQNIFVGTSATSDASTDDCALYIYRFNEDDTYTLAYTITYGEQVLDVHAANGKLYVLTATEPHGNTAYNSGSAGGALYESFWRVRVYDDYFPLENVPVENDNRRVTASLQTRPPDGDVIGVGSFYYNDQSVGRMSINESGAVLMSIASIGAGRQEWGWLGWLEPGAEQATRLVDSLEVSKWRSVDGADLSVNAIGLDAQWGGVAGELKERVVWSVGDPVVSTVQVALSATILPAETDQLVIVGPAFVGDTNTNSLTIIFGGVAGLVQTGSGPWDWTVTIGGGAGGLPADQDATGDQLISAMEIAHAHSNWATQGVGTRITKQAAASANIHVHSPDPSTTFAAATGSVLAAQVVNAWADSPTSALAFGSSASARRAMAIVDTSGTEGELSLTNTNSFGVALDGYFTGVTPQASYVRMGQDFGNGLYIPWGRASSLPAYSGKDVHYIPNDSTSITSFTLGGPSYIAAAAAPLFTPEYGQAFTHAPFIITGGPVVTTTTGDPSIYRHDVVTVTQALTNPRTIAVIAAVGNKVMRVLDASIVDVENGSVIDANAPYIQMTPGYEKIYIADGSDYWVFNPKNTDVNANGDLTRLSSTTYGTIPPRCRLIETYRGRLVLGRDPADPGRWHMSAIGDPNNWDTFPQIASASQAASWSSSKAGLVPDIINAMVPWNDDAMLFGGDRSIWQLTGDPMAGGVLDLITDETGMSFGRPYCKDPSGILWFFGSTGGLYRMIPGAIPERMSLGRVERQLREVDLANYYIRLQWNQMDEGLHIFQIPFGAGGTIVDQWFYEEKAGAFHKDKFGSLATHLIQPTAVVRLDGDASSDRTMLMGCEDGRIRRWGRDSSGAIPKSDEQTTVTNLAIDSYILIGPLVNDPIEAAQQLTELDAVLSSSQHGCNFEVFTSDEPDVLGLPAATGSFRAGRNDKRLIRTSGDHVYLRLRNSSIGESWAFEGGSALVAYAGDARR